MSIYNLVKDYYESDQKETIKEYLIEKATETQSFSDECHDLYSCELENLKDKLSSTEAFDYLTFKANSQGAWFEHSKQEILTAEDLKAIEQFKTTHSDYLVLGVYLNDEMIEGYVDHIIEEYLQEWKEEIKKEAEELIKRLGGGSNENI